MMVMSAVDLATRSATELAGLIRTRDVSAVEVVEATLARIDALNPSLNAFISVDRDRARREAAAADADIRRGETRGPLLGVPLSIKSSMEVEGQPWETGSASRRGIRGTDRRHHRHAAQKRGRHHPRRHQRGRAADGVGDRQSALRTLAEPLGPHANTWRIERR